MISIRSLHIGPRLAGGFSIVIALLIVVVAISSSLVHQNKRRLKDGLETAYRKRQLASDMKSALLERGIAMRNMLDVSTVDKQIARVANQRKIFDGARQNLLLMSLSPQEIGILREIESLEADIAAEYDVAVRQARNMNFEGAASVITMFIDPINTKSFSTIDRLLAIEQSAASKVLENSENEDTALMFILLGITIVAVSLGAATSWWITRSITAPLNHAVALAEQVSIGDLTAQIESDGSDEVGRLLAALHKMIKHLNTTITDVRATAGLIFGTAEKFSHDSSSLSARVESQASFIEGASSTMIALTNAVRQNAEHAKHTNQQVVATCDIAVQGEKMVEDVISTMIAIKESSRQVSDITSVIDGIAFQTNILALNAAVEAARAGEQGKGFAVVASEVRGLAQRSASAAKEINVLLRESVARTEAGHMLVIEAGKTIREVLSSVKEIASTVAEIQVASEEQCVRIEEVTGVVAEMDNTTQSNARLVEEVAIAGRAMYERSFALETSAKVFRVKDKSEEIFSSLKVLEV